METVSNVVRNGVSANSYRPSNALCDVILLVDASASLSGVFQVLMNEYILPCLEYFSGGTVDNSSSTDLQYGPVQFGLVTMNSPGLTYRQACTFYPVTCDVTRVLQWLKEMRFEGGLVEHSLRLSEGYAAVLELCDLMSTTREPCLGPDQAVEQYCLLVCNFPPSNHSCVESMKYGGKTHQQLSKIMIERKLKVSVISPRNLIHFKNIFEKGLIDPDSNNKDLISDCQHSLHSGHIALFQGFSLPNLKTKRDELMKKAKENEMKQTTLTKIEARMDIQSTVPQTNGGIPNTEKSTQLLTATQYDSSKTPPNQTSPIGANRNPSPSISKPSSSVVDENPSSVPPPSVFAAPSPRDLSNVASPQRQLVSGGTTLTSVSPTSAATAAPVTRVTQLHTTRASISGSLPVSATVSPSSGTQQNQQLQGSNRTLSQSGTQPPSSQSSHMGAILSQPLNQNQLNQGGSPNIGQQLNRTIPPSGTAQSHSPMSQGFPNVVATCTSFPTASSSPIISHLGATTTPQGQRQPVTSMAAAVAAAENALMEAQAQVLPSRIGLPSIPGVSVGLGPPGMATPAMTSQPNTGLTSLVGSTSTTVTTGVATQSPLQPGQQNVTGPQTSAVQPSNQQQLTMQHGTSRPSSVGGGSTVQSQFGAQGGGQPQGQSQGGIAPSISRGPQQMGGTQSSFPNPAMVVPGHLQQQQSLQAGMSGGQGTSSTLQQQQQQQTPQQPLQSVSQPIMATSMQPPGQQMQVHPGQPGAFGGPAQQQVQTTIWTGTVDVMEQYAHSILQQQRGQRQVKRPMQCYISAKRDHILELHPESWPATLTMQAYPKQATSMIMSLMKLNQQQNMVRVVTFNFAEPPEQVYTLRLLMSSDQTQKHFGIVHFNSVTPQPIKALILVWNEKAMQFTGLIPLEQDKFVEVLKQVFNRRQPQPGQQLGMSGPQQPQMMGNQQVPQQPGVSTMPGQQQMEMGAAAQSNQPGASSDPSTLSSMSINPQMGTVGMQPQPTSAQQSKNSKQLEKIIYLLEHSSPEQQQQIFQKMPQLTQDMQQSLLRRVHALRLQKQQLQRQQLHAMNQQQQQQQQQQPGGMLGGPIPDVMNQLGITGGMGQSPQQQQQQQQSQIARPPQPQQQGMPQGSMQMGMQRQAQPQQSQQQPQQQTQQPPGMDPNFQWQS